MRLLCTNLKPNTLLATLAWLFVLALFGAASAAEVATQPSSYLPLIQGAEWHYEATTAEGATLAVVVAMGVVTEKSGVATVPVTSKVTMNQAGVVSAPAIITSLRYERSPYELLSHHSDGDTRIVLKLPCEPGRTWPYRGGQASIALESVSTPLGTFKNAIKVGVSYPEGGSESFWYAPDVGLVKYLAVGPDKRPSTLTLTRFHRPDALPSLPQAGDSQ